MFPLSAQQQIVWLQHQTVPDSRAYYSSAVVNFHGRVDSAVLRKSVVDAVGRHDAMRLRICDLDSPVPHQEIVEQVSLDIPEYDLRGVEESEGRRAELLHQQMHTEFDLQAAPLARWMMVRLADDHWQLFMTEHHLVHDGRSTVAFLRDVLAQYAAEESGGSFLPVGAPSYQEYVAHITSDEYREAVAASVEWWTENLKDAAFLVEFPELAEQRSELFDYRGGQYRQSLPADLMAEVRTAAQRGGHTVFSAMLAVYAELCRRYSGQHDLVIGMPMANCPARFENTVGMMVNTVPVRLVIDPSAPCSEVGVDALAAIFEAVDHESAPVQDLVKALGLSGKGLDNPLFNVTFGMHDRPFPAVDVPGLTVDMQVALSTRSARFDLSVFVTPGAVLHGDEGEYGYELSWDYSTQRFDSDDVELIATAFETLLRAYAANPLEPIGSLALAEVAPSPRAAQTAPEVRDAVEEAAPATPPRPAAGQEDRADSPWLVAFRDILERDDIDEQTDFFQAGGYSLLVPKLLSRYASLSGWRPPTSLVFEFSSPSELEAASAARRPSAADVR